MKKIFALFMLLMATCCVAPTTPKAPAAIGPDVAETLKKTVALARLVDDDGVDTDVVDSHIKIFCSGTWIGDHEVLTAEHCVEDLGLSKEERELRNILREFGLEPPENNPVGKSTWILAYEAQEAPLASVVESIDRMHDLAVVRVAFPASHISAKMAPDVVVGEPVAVAGHPARQGWTFMRGMVSALRPDHASINGPGTVDVVQIQVPVYYGNSGGGAFNARGELVGVCSFLVEGWSGMGFFTNIEYVR